MCIRDSFWYTFWYPNVHSMLTEVTFCITCYLCVLAIEYVPQVLRNRRLRQAPGALVFELSLIHIYRPNANRLSMLVWFRPRRRHR